MPTKGLFNAQEIHSAVKCKSVIDEILKVVADKDHPKRTGLFSEQGLVIDQEALGNWSVNTACNRFRQGLKLLARPEYNSTSHHNYRELLDIIRFTPNKDRTRLHITVRQDRLINLDGVQLYSLNEAWRDRLLRWMKNPVGTFTARQSSPYTSEDIADLKELLEPVKKEDTEILVDGNIMTVVL